MDYAKLIETIPGEVLVADDDVSLLPYWPEDDYVFDVKRSSISTYMIVYFLAALSFVFVGILQFGAHTGYLSGGAMILAGLFGLVASMLVEKNPKQAEILNLVSVHLFFLQAIQILYWRRKLPALWLHVGDVFFVVGSLIDIILGYVAVMGTYKVAYAKTGIFAGCLWLVAAIVYVLSTILHGTEDEVLASESSSKEDPSTQQHTLCNDEDEEVTA